MKTNSLFEGLINSFMENKVGLAENFLDETLSAALQANLLALYDQNQLHEAGIGNNAKLIRKKNLRSDVIYWLDRKHNNPTENSFFDLMDSFVAYLNETCYTGITGYEFHYAMYEAGSFYKRHLDQFKDNTSRQYSVIMYLNLDWKVGDGGELCIYDGDNTQLVEPTNGKAVFFKSSELEHEVLMSHAPRLSVTGWLKR